MVIVADTELYSARNSVLQHYAQAAFDEALASAGSAAGVDRQQWHRQPSGDGELAVLPPDIDEPLLLSAFLPALDTYLRRYNADRAAHARVRLRVAIHQGLIFLDSRNGFAGGAVNDAARLVDAPVLKSAFKAFPEANVACIVSDTIHRDVVTGGYDGIRPERFRRVTVDLPEKSFSAVAWIQIVGEDVTSTRAEAAAAASRPRLAAHHGGTSVGDVSNAGDGQVVIGEGATGVGYWGGGRGRGYE
ncbi:hypothetical protein [Paractinoplanes deccanensis]|uniref:hypothetical protein n=1 Tax=Paractinoplanes deccanensis TaxID=113561 RepID=UPI001943AA3A|nr:hypothetical protein [Actinoplanes deccanensis]